MPYIGKEPVAGNFVLLDSITTSATATYALTKDSVAYSPESARNMIVSLNGVTQAPEAAFTVSGSNITFSSALTSSDVIDYILVLGDVLSVGTPSDGTVGTSQMSYPLGNFSSTGIDDNATSTAITIDSSENVGIGTSSPAKLLETVATGAGSDITALQVRNNSSSTSTSTSIRFVNSTGNTSTAGGAEVSAIRNASDGGALTFKTAADSTATLTERMRITSSGNVGIGNLATNAKLEVTATSGEVFRADASGGAYRIVATQTGVNLNGNVGIGTSSPGTLLEINQNAENVVRIRSADGTIAGILFGDQSDLSRGSIYYSNSDESMQFRVNNQVEAMRIDSSGRLLIGKTAISNSTAGYFLEPGSGGYASFVNTTSSASNRVILVNRQGATSGRLIEFRSANSTCGHIAARGSSTSSFVAYPNSGNGAGISGSTNMIIPSDEDGAAQDNRIQLGSTSTRWKHLYLSGGVFLGGTGSSNQLDDYEEGTWTPSIGTGTASFSNATYTKIGRIVVVTLFFQSISDQSSSAALQISNLPFASDSNTFASATGLSRWINRGNGTVVAYLGGNTTTVFFYALSAGADYLNVRHQDLNNASANYYATITYIAA